MLSKQKQKPSNLRLSQNHRGVTLVEVIAVIAVLSIVMAAVTGFMLTGTKMSAQVSNGATVSARQQTAAEFINKTLVGIDPKMIVVSLEEDNQIKDEHDTVIGYRVLHVCEQKGQDLESVASLYAAEDGRVIYKTGSREVELCTGGIYFGKYENNTVTYYLGGTKHVLHLRTA